MKKIAFTAHERNWLAKLLLERISLYSSHMPKEKVLDHAVSAMFKLEEGLPVNLKGSEKTQCLSVVNEKMPELYTNADIHNAYSLLIAKADEREILQYIDMGKSILIKLGEHKSKSQVGHDFSSFYSEWYAKLEKLKNCDLIYISRVEKNNVYKIGFVHQGKEASVYELSHEVRPDDLIFYTIGTDAKKYGERHFSLVTDKKGALDILSGCDESSYPANQLAFFKQLLN